jgi:hypothetical protein
MKGTQLCGRIAPVRIAAASQALRNDPQMRQAFINQVAGPIVNKMFECGMAPEVARRSCVPMALAMKCFSLRWVGIGSDDYVASRSNEFG